MPRADVQLRSLVESVGAYPEEAYLFVREGLNRGIEQIHGPPTRGHLRVAKYLAEANIDLAELQERLEQGRLDGSILAAVEESGGVGNLNRHIGGPDVCWALRDLAVERWGMLATMVLASWGITGTLDFGRIVFAMIAHGYMQKQPQDRLEDFDRVFDFEESMTRCYRVGQVPQRRAARAS